MQFLYHIFTYIFMLGFRIVSLFNPKAKRGWNGRENWEITLKNKIDPKSKWIWMHCSSLGEFEQGRPVFEALKDKYPNYKFALSFFSPSGFDIRKNYEKADVVFYLPFDTPENARKLSQILKPELWILAKYDYWYNHLKYQSEKGVKIIVISAIFRPNHIFFKSYGKWFRNRLKKNVDKFYVQDSLSKELLYDAGISQVEIAGDTRFDRVKTVASKTNELDFITEFKQNDYLIVVGSSWKEDEDLWVKFINEKLPNNWKIVIVPHEIKKQNIERLRHLMKKNTLLFSSFNSNSDENKILRKAKVLIIDTIGMLSKIYASADLAYVGGGFNKSGVHNTLEPSVFGVPVIIGPNYSKFNEVKALKEEGVVFPISNYTQFYENLVQLIEDKIYRKNIHEKAVAFFSKQPPSTQIIIEDIEGWIK